MSFLSRFFRKAPPTPLAPQKLPEPVAPAAPVPSVPDRALLAAKEEEALRAAIDSQDTQTITRMVLEGTSTRIRQLAAQAIDDPVLLRQLLKDARGGNDKSVYRILARKRDALLAQEREREQIQAEINAVSTAIERHSHRPYDPLFTPALEQLENRWKAVVAHAEPDVAQAVQHAVDRSREVIALHLREVAAQAARELAAANAAAEAQRQRELEEKAAAQAAEERARLLEEERKAEAEKQEALDQALRQIGGLVRKAHGALNAGSSGRAAALRRAIDEKLATAPPLPAHLTNQIQKLDAKLEELKDWKSFTVAPKRAELIEEMESLAGSTLDPPALANRIKSLQGEWRTLSKGAGENLEADWQRFQEAAQKAYQPCKEYFEARSRVKQENLQQRAALIEQLATFEAQHNWEQPDWRAVVAMLRDSRQQWRQYSPVDPAEGKPVQEKFDAVMASLQGRLDAEYARNVKEKRLLIERVQRLLASEDTRKAIDDVKALQQKWKATGPVPRDEDRKLWEEFRQQCDAVFQKRQQEHAQYASGLEANQSRAVELCDELEKIAGLSGPELQEGTKKLPDLRAAFEALGEFPKGRAREVHKRFERALERCEAALAQQQARDAEHSWTALFDAANHVRAYRLAVARNADSAELDRLKQTAENFIAAVTRWPRGGLESIRKALAKADGHDLAANERALRKLCIRAEILTDAASPPEDQQLRREYQVQRLMEGMGQGIAADKGELDALTFEWIGTGPTEEGTYLQLVERFKRSRQRAIEQHAR
jgi:hypothetical protein